jgi:hypothetical protein
MEIVRRCLMVLVLLVLAAAFDFVALVLASIYVALTTPTKGGDSIFRCFICGRRWLFHTPKRRKRCLNEPLPLVLTEKGWQRLDRAA